jgi:hypothetical protein
MFLESILAKGRDHPLLHCELGFSTPVNVYVYGVELPFSKEVGAGDPSQTGPTANVLYVIRSSGGGANSAGPCSQLLQTVSQSQPPITNHSGAFITLVTPPVIHSCWDD